MFAIKFLAKYECTVFFQLQSEITILKILSEQSFTNCMLLLMTTSVEIVEKFFSMVLFTLPPYHRPVKYIVNTVVSHLVLQHLISRMDNGR